MEMESLHTLDHVETTRLARSSQPASYRNAQVWKDIKAETGFASYEDYLEFYKDVRPDCLHKLVELHHNAEFGYGFAKMETIIIDLSIQDDSSVRLSQRRNYYSGTELIHALRKPPDGVCVQLVFWDRTDSPLSQQMIDTLGLGLRLDPDDFAYRERWSPPPRKLRSYIGSIFVEQTVAAISQGFMRDVVNEVPVVLVASAIGGCYWDSVALSSIPLYWKSPPFCKSPRVFMPFERKPVGYQPLYEAGSNYVRAVHGFIVQGRDVQPTKQSLLLAAMSPLLCAEVGRMTNHMNKVQTMYTDLVFVVSDKGREPRVSQEDLDKHRLELRRITEVNEDILGQFSRYLGSEGHADLIDQPSYVSIVANLRNLIADARRLDAEIRDFKQIQVGDLALKESQKSIELSNAQIREAKSGKFPTNDMCVDYTNVSQ